METGSRRTGRGQVGAQRKRRRKRRRTAANRPGIQLVAGFIPIWTIQFHGLMTFPPLNNNTDSLSMSPPFHPLYCRRLNEHLQFIIMTPIRFRIVAIAFCNKERGIIILGRGWWWLELWRYLIGMFQQQYSGDYPRPGDLSVFYGLTRRLHIRRGNGTSGITFSATRMTIFIMSTLYSSFENRILAKCGRQAANVFLYCGGDKEQGRMEMVMRCWADDGCGWLASFWGLKRRSRIL